MPEYMPCFDSHFHIIDPAYPLVSNNGFLPEPFTADDYLSQISHLNIAVKGGAVVSGSFQAFDTSYLEHALHCLGPSYVGVINMRHTVSDADILHLHQIGVRAVRFNLYRGGSESIKHLEIMAKRIYDLAKWHVELYVSANQLKELKSLLLRLPKISIDHLGLTENGANDLLDLVDHGAHIKATRFSILNFDVSKKLKQIYHANPDSLMFGSDLPSTRAPRLVNNDDIQIFLDCFAADELKKVMLTNALQLYHDRFKS